MEIFLEERQKYRMWLITKEGRLHYYLRYKFKNKGDYIKKIFSIWLHYIKNDCILFPHLCRNPGSNYNSKQRILNTLVLILFTIITTAIITINNDHNKECLLNTKQYTTFHFKNNNYICIKMNEYSQCILGLIILDMFHYLIRLLYQRINPNKLKNIPLLYVILYICMFMCFNVAIIYVEQEKSLKEYVSILMIHHNIQLKLNIKLIITLKEIKDY